MDDDDPYLHFHCPACKSPLSVPRELAGVEGPCPTCGAEIQAPFGDEEEAGASETPVAGTSEPSPPASISPAGPPLAPRRAELAEEQQPPEPEPAGPSRKTRWQQEHDREVALRGRQLVEPDRSMFEKRGFLRIRGFLACVSVIVLFAALWVLKERGFFRRKPAEIPKELPSRAGRENSGVAPADILKVTPPKSATVPAEPPSSILPPSPPKVPVP